MHYENQLQPSSPYSHLPLSGVNSFRVLDLEPSISLQTPLKCSIREVSFTEARSGYPKYHALSYVWGKVDVQTLDLIYIQNAPDCYDHLEISPNCANALRNLRFPKQKRTLWVDSICINQKSLEEKNLQIPLMGQLYSTAERVILWLDLDHIASTDWKRLIRHLKQTMWVLSNGYLRRSPKGESQNFQPVTSLCEKYFIRRTKQLTGLFMSILRNEYFERVWTVQEFMLARVAGAIVVSEHGTIPLHDFLIGIDMFVEWAAYLDSRTSTVVEMVEVINRNPLCKFVGTYMRRTEKAQKAARLVTQFSPLLITNVNHLKCSEERDKAYAFLWALDAACSKEDREGLSLFDVNYSKSVEQVYIELSVAIATLSGANWFLYNACQNVKSYSLPSWVSDWSSPTQDRYWYHTSFRHFRAGSGGGRVLKPLEFRGDSMFVDGVLVTTVSHRFDIPIMVIFDSINPTDGQSTDEMLAMLDLLFKVFEVIRIWTSGQPDRVLQCLHDLDQVLFLPDNTAFDKSKKEVYFATTKVVSTNTVRMVVLWQVVAVWISMRPADATKATLNVQDTQALELELVDILAPFLTESQVRKYLHSLKPLPHNIFTIIFELGQLCQHAIDFMRPLCFPRVPEIDTLFLTADARFGAGVSVREGDHVAVWDGLDCAVVLRKHDTWMNQCGPWTLHSIAQVSGLMKGEAYEGDEVISFEVR